MNDDSAYQLANKKAARELKILDVVVKRNTKENKVDYAQVARYYERNKGKILKKVQRRVGQEDGEDVMQEIFTRIIAHYDKFDPKKGRFGAWVDGITRNCIKDCQKDQRNRGIFVPIDTITDIESIEPHFEDNSVEVEQESGRILEKINRKGHPARDILYLTYIMQNTPQEIVKILGLQYTNVVMHIYRFKKEMNRND